MNTYIDVIGQCRENDKRCQWADSIEPLKQAMLMPEADYHALELLLNAYSSSGLDSDAVRYVLQLTKEKRDRKKFVTPETLYEFSLVLNHTCRPDSVYPEAFMRKFKASFPESPRPFCEETHSFMADDRYEEALESVKEQEMHGGQCVFCLDVYSWLANHFGLEGPPRLDIDSDLTRHPDEEIWRACSLAGYDKDKESQRIYLDELMIRFPDSRRARLEHLYLDWPDKEKSEKWLKELRSLFPQDQSSRLWEFAFYMEQGQFDLARAAWQDLIRDEPWLYIFYGEPNFGSTERKFRRHHPRGALARSIDDFYRDVKKAMHWMLP